MISGTQVLQMKQWTFWLNGKNLIILSKKMSFSPQEYSLGIEIIEIRKLLTSIVLEKESIAHTITITQDMKEERLFMKI